MATFTELLTASETQLVNQFYGFLDLAEENLVKRLDLIARKIGLSSTCLVLGLGFNREMMALTDILSVLGFDSYESLCQRRDQLFAKDIYKNLSLDDLQIMYEIIKENDELIESLQDLLIERLDTIEAKIEGSVNTRVIDNYKQELRIIYSEGVGQIVFAEKRLTSTQSGFRSLTNEVAIIVDFKVLPAGDLFFRNSILPEEKRKLIKKGLISDELIITRLEDPNISLKERKMLKDFI